MIHYERLMNFQNWIQPPEVIIDGKPFLFTHENVINHVLSTYDHNRDVLDDNHPHVPTAFLENTYVRLFLKIHVEMYKELLEQGIDIQNDSWQSVAPSLFANKASITGIDKLGSFEADFDDGELRVINTQVRILYHAFNMRRHHERICKVPEGLYDALGKSDYPAKMEMIRPPFPEFYLLLPTTTGLKLPTTDVPLEGMYVSLEDTVKGQKRLAVLACQRPRKLVEIGLEDVYFFESYFDQNMGVDEAIDKAIAGMLPVSRHDMRLESKADPYSEIKPIIGLIFKVLLYMDSWNASIVFEKGSEEKVTKKRMKKFAHRAKSRMDYAILGSDIIISPNNTQYATENTGLGTQHRYRYMVRGHWHCYWKKYLPDGIKESQIIDTKEDEYGNPVYKVRQYVKYYFKGPEYAEVINKDYKIKEFEND